MMPAIIEEIVDATDLETGRRIARARGGRYTRFPLSVERLKDDHWLIQAAGRDGAQKIIRVLGGDRFVVPFWETASGLRMRTKAAIRRALAAGKSSSQIAAELGVHERTVRRHKLVADREKAG